MLKFLLGRSIYARVMAVIKARIAKAQQDYDDAVVQMNEDHNREVYELENQLFARKEALADQMVSDILKPL